MTDLKAFTPRQLPGQSGLEGQYTTLHPVDWAQHGTALFQALGGPGNEALWTYISFGPFDQPEHFSGTMQAVGRTLGWQTLVIGNAQTGNLLGTASYMRLRPDVGSAEVGCVLFGSELQRTRMATEAMYLMARHIFEDLGYRRYEWKCDNRNEASKRAAVRYGFQYEGVFRNDLIVKSQNRDTAWFSIIDTEWPSIKTAFEAWLDPENFDNRGRQERPLVDFQT